jgi:MFS superfamily sulfate permease-like transporter
LNRYYQQLFSDEMIGGNHKSNMELVAQGTANIFSSIFGAYLQLALLHEP